MKRVVIAGAALGLAAAVVSYVSDDEEFCTDARDDRLLASTVPIGRGAHDELADYRVRLAEAAESAPAAIADEVEDLRDAAAKARRPRQLRGADVAEPSDAVRTWVAENC